MNYIEARNHIKNITKKYFQNAEVDFANKSHRPKAMAPYVCITLGSPVRDLHPVVRLVGDRLVSYYQTHLPVQIDLFTHGSDAEPDDTGYVNAEDTAVDDLTDFLDYLESEYVHDWLDRIDAGITTDGVIQPLTGLITDSDYEYRAMLEFSFGFIHKAVGHAGIEGERSIQHPSEPEYKPGDPEDPSTPSDKPNVKPSKIGDGSEAGYFEPDDAREDVTVKPVYEPTASGGRSKDLVENTETGYFTEVEIEYKKEESE